MAQENVPSGMAEKGDAGDSEESEWVAAASAFREDHPDLRDLSDDALAQAMALELQATAQKLQLQVGPEELADESLLPVVDEEVPPSPDEAKERIARKWQARNAESMEEIEEYPAVKGMMEYETQREKDLAEVREAFVKAQRRKQK
jgi:hypothetical protein